MLHGAIPRLRLTFGPAVAAAFAGFELCHTCVRRGRGRLTPRRPIEHDPMSKPPSRATVPGVPVEDAPPDSRRSAPNTCTVIHDRGSEEYLLQPGERGEAPRRERLLLDRRRSAATRPTTRFSATSWQVQIRSPSRSRRSSRNGQARRNMTTSFSSWSTEPSPTTTASVEVHCFSRKSSSSPSTGRSPGVHRRAATLRQEQEAGRSTPGKLLYRIIDALVDSFFPILADFNNRIDELEIPDLPECDRRTTTRDLPDETVAGRYAQSDHTESATCSQASQAVSPSSRA